MYSINIDLADLSEAFNSKYLPLLWNRTKNLFLYGGAGSGKSHFAAEKILLRIILGFNKGIVHKFLLIRKTQPSLRRSSFALINHYIDAWGLKGLVDVNKTDMTFSFYNGSQILCVGLDDVQKLKSIEGITGVWIEEVNEITYNDFIQIVLRLRGNTPSYKQIIGTFNPVDIAHWLKVKIQDSGYPNTEFIHTTYKDNRFIDKEYCEILEDLVNHDENFHRIYAKGEWGVLENLIYSKYTTVTFLQHFDERIYGLDFGYNSPTAMVEIRFQDDKLWERELLYKTKMTNQDLVSWMERNNISKESPIYADAEDPNRIKEISDAGFEIYPAEKKSVKARLDYCKRLEPRITSDSINLLKEIKAYKYKVDKNGNVLDEPIKFMDHLMDARGYAYYTHHLQKGGTPAIFTTNELMEEFAEKGILYDKIPIVENAGRIN